MIYILFVVMMIEHHLLERRIDRLFKRLEDNGKIQPLSTEPL